MGLSVSISKKLGTFSLDAEWAVDDELAVLFGYSGSGKSLTLRAVAGLLIPDRGTIELNGQILFSGDDGRVVPTQLRSIGFVFQDLALFPHMTVEENILYGGHGVSSRERQERCRDMVRRFRLTGLEHRRPVDLSGGQRQRVALARTLIRRPAALLLDEPFSALDAPLRREMRGLLREVQRELRIPVVLVTHDLTEALELADMLILYVDGRVEQCATPREVVKQPASGSVRRLISPELFQHRDKHDDNQERAASILPICCAGA
ncbi:MAG: ATP-binding cassette domain-containing protein [Nitrospirota bacterium]|nr:ATP-binding cassette domain-containing protein [Nitrospirota bacterium]